MKQTIKESHYGLQLHMLARKWHSGSSKPKAGQHRMVGVALYWNSHYAIWVPACVL